MKFKAVNYNLTKSMQGDVLITFTVDKESAYSVLQVVHDNDLQGELSVEIKKWRNARSKDQNRLLWSIETKLAEKLNLPTHEVHKQNVLSYSVKLGEALMQQKFAENYAKNNYARIKKYVVERGVEMAVVEIFAGSSELDTKQFTTLVDGVLHECDNVGIDVRRDAENLKSLLQSWEESYEKKKQTK